MKGYMEVWYHKDDEAAFERAMIDAYGEDEVVNCVADTRTVGDCISVEYEGLPGAGRTFALGLVEDPDPIGFDIICHCGPYDDGGPMYYAQLAGERFDLHSSFDGRVLLPINEDGLVPEYDAVNAAVFCRLRKQFFEKMHAGGIFSLDNVRDRE